MSETIDLVTTPTGILLPVRAQPKARRNALNGVHDGQLKVQVTEAPENGRANSAIVKLLAKTLGLKRSQIALHTGATSPQKTFVVTGCAADELDGRISGALAADE